MADSPHPGSLARRVAIVTGAGQGMGREHALLLARQGARVLVNDLGVTMTGEPADPERADRVAAEIRAAGGEAIASRESAATFDGAARIVQAAVDAYGRLDILINNAMVIRLNDLWKWSEEDWDAVLDSTLKGYFAMIRHAAPHLARSGSGAIVNISSASGFGHPAMVAYASAKEGLIGLTRTVARELGRFGVRCNAVRPGAATESATVAYPKIAGRWAALAAATAVGTTRPVAGPRYVSPSRADPKEASPAKVAQFVVWLCTDAAANVNGRTFHARGDRVGLYSEPELTRVLYTPGGWDLDSLDRAGAAALTGDLTNDYLLEDHPELRQFEA